MDNQYLTFRKFQHPEDAAGLTELLVAANIVYQVEEYASSFDPAFANNPAVREIRVKIQPQDFNKADAILLEASRQELDAVDPSHYLFGFTDEELLEIITKPDEWSHFDFLLAQKILKERGKEINPQVVELLKKQRLDALAKPEDTQHSWVVAGYLMAVLGGLFGVFIGWHLATFRKTLPNGDRVYAYAAADRRHGSRIVVLGIIGVICWALARMPVMLDW